MLLEPFLDDFVADRQRALREAAEHGGAGTSGPDLWRLVPPASPTAAPRSARWMAPRPGRRGRVACKHWVGPAVTATRL